MNEGGTVAASGPEQGAGHANEDRRVLIVEDNWLVAIEIEAALSEAGYEVVGLAMSADQAVRLCGSERPAVVLMDIRLQGRLDGVSAAVEILQRYGIRSVFVTAHGDPETRARAEAAQPLGWILKPMVWSELGRRLEQIRTGQA
ncbi:response regulator [Geminicoccus flavidas]|uniref:response regulator n=1 Tax=Geminicoccus flavidas TaxID=2506407 RepID=UPI00135B5C40|nr:response regulator [Geminicoccus flavidas]